jgi:hypothetical protein
MTHAPLYAQPVLQSGPGPADFLDVLRAATGRAYELPKTHPGSGREPDHHDELPHFRDRISAGAGSRPGCRSRRSSHRPACARPHDGVWRAGRVAACAAAAIS